MSPNLLEVRNATKFYGGSVLKRSDQIAALKDFSMIIPEKPANTRYRRRVAAVNHPGEPDPGFITPTSGQILYRGQDVAALSTGSKA
jgi:hypothetical protein